MYNSVSMNDFEALNKQKKLAIIDVREVEEFQAGHVPNAKNYPLSRLNEDYVSLADEDEYYVICRSGKRSELACQFLAEQGFEVSNVLGGTIAWSGELELPQ